MRFELILLQILMAVSGTIIIVVTLSSAVNTLVMPRSVPDIITRIVFSSIRKLFALRLKRTRSYQETDRIMALYAPVAVLLLLPVWLIMALVGYAMLFWAIDPGDWYLAFRISGSSLLTLGFTAPEGWLSIILEFSEAAIGLILVALLIAYLPTMYAAFSRRESKVTLLEVRAGSPPWAITVLERYQRIHGLDKLSDEWQDWEKWFADIEESHTSLPALVFFRSPQPNHSWITAAAAILDSASLMQSSVDLPNDPRAALCIRAGYLAVRRIADYFNIHYDPEPKFPDVKISISQEEFNAALDQLVQNNIPIREDREQAWQDFAGWRVNYDQVLLQLAELIVAPEAPWTGKRSDPKLQLSGLFNPK